MSLSSDSPVIRTSYPETYNNRCVICGSPVKFLYPANPRVHHGLENSITEIRYFYACTNKNCYFFNKPHNPSPNYSLPFKHYDLSVWKWIGRESKIFKQNANGIKNRIEKEFGLDISENTIRSVIDELDVFLSGEIDKKTKKILKTQGKIVLCLDGQAPEADGDALWLFVDAISNRVLKTKILTSATHEILHDIVEEILTEYEVKLVGIVSDKQINIVKMRDKFYPKAPHQYCQYHFLGNLWKHIEYKDQKLHSSLASCVNSLYIVNVDQTSTVKIPNVGKVKKREFFSNLESDLRKLVKPRNKKFKKLRGVESWNNVANYALTLKEVVESKDPTHRVTKVLSKVCKRLNEGLESTQPIFHDCCDLFDEFNDIRLCLKNSDLDRMQMESEIKKRFEAIWKDVKKKDKIIKKTELKIAYPTNDASKLVIEKEWVRLYESYRRGLFSYFDFPIPERTNSKMEQHFGQEKIVLYRTCGKKNVGPQVRVRGEYIIKQQYAGEEEVSNIIQELSEEYDLERIKTGLIELNKRRSTESDAWQTNILGKQALLDLYKEEKKDKD